MMIQKRVKRKKPNERKSLQRQKKISTILTLQNLIQSSMWIHSSKKLQLNSIQVGLIIRYVISICTVCSMAKCQKLNSNIRKVENCFYGFWVISKGIAYIEVMERQFQHRVHFQKMVSRIDLALDQMKYHDPYLNQFLNAKHCRIKDSLQQNCPQKPTFENGLHAKYPNSLHTNGRAQEFHEVLSPYGPHVYLFAAIGQ